MVSGSLHPTPVFDISHRAAAPSVTMTTIHMHNTGVIGLQKELCLRGPPKKAGVTFDRIGWGSKAAGRASEAALRG